MDYGQKSSNQPNKTTRRYNFNNSSIKLALEAFPLEIWHLNPSRDKKNKETTTVRRKHCQKLRKPSEQAHRRFHRLRQRIQIQPYTFPPWNINFNINLELTKFKKTTLPIIRLQISRRGWDNNYNSIFKLLEACSIYTAETIVKIAKLIQEKINQAKIRGSNIFLIWIPGH
ncbi:Uncharacterized protein FWK35_00013515, partial [Aphis craccivora]